MERKYQQLRDLLRPQLKWNRDREVRVKAELILLAAKLGNVSEACARRGFGRKFFYKWWGRLRRGNFQLHALREESRRPKRSPHRTSPNVARKIHGLRRGTNAGAEMIRALLMREGIKISKSVVCHILNGRKKVKRTRKEVLKAHRRRYELDLPGQRLQVDVKYVPEPVEGRRVYVYSAVDECTRWRFARGYTDLCGGSTKDFLQLLKAKCPFPIHCIQTDNGFEFTYRLIPQAESKKMPLHLMEEWCSQNHIRHRCIPPGEKELNGKVERAHRIDEQYFYWKAPTDNLEHFNEAMDEWIYRYNHHRPHGGLSFATPAEKLQERLKTLQGFHFLDKGLEALKLRFLEQTPMKFGKREERELLRLQAAILRWKMAA